MSFQVLLSGQYCVRLSLSVWFAVKVQAGEQPIVFHQAKVHPTFLNMAFAEDSIAKSPPPVAIVDTAEKLARL